MQPSAHPSSSSSSNNAMRRVAALSGHIGSHDLLSEHTPASAMHHTSANYIVSTVMQWMQANPTLAGGVGVCASTVAALLYKFPLMQWQFALLGIKVKLIAKKAATEQWTISDMWERRVQESGRKRTVFLYEDRKWTFGQVDKMTNQVAHFLLGTTKARDCVGLYMENRPEYFATWMGCAKQGGVTALINTNQKDDILKHSITVAECKMIIFGPELADNIREIMPWLQEQGIAVYSYGPSRVDFADSLDDILPRHSTKAVAKECGDKARGVHNQSTFAYIYTSGTTGLPKAANINAARVVSQAGGMGLMAGMTADDRVYCSMPLYHSAAGSVGIGMMLLYGNSIALRAKFSATQFFPDIVKYKCTSFQYIGELCRYVLATPASPADTKHNVKMCIGNGLRPDIWDEFKARFQIPRIVEFYGSTEGAQGMINWPGKTGAVGYVAPLVSSMFPVELLKIDEDTMEVFRGDDGIAVKVAPGQSGEMVCELKVENGVTNYSGYKGKEGKLLKDVNKKGDCFVRTGDLLKRDEEGFYYFMDRLGDTFRWKGENVATSEVSHVISGFAAGLEPNVYGVQVPGKDGRCGMVSLRVLSGDKVDFKKLAAYISDKLPAYARPLFIRLPGEMEITGTLKHRKVDLQKQGFDPSTVEDPLFFFTGDDYVPVDQALYERIVSGQERM